MFKIDVNDYLEKSAMRKARFGGYEPDDVRRAMRELFAAYEQALVDAEKQQQESRAESDALRRRCQTLLGQVQSLTAQNATLAAKADKLNGEQIDWETRYNKVQERNHSLSDQVAVLRLKNNDLVRENSELAEQAADAAAALRIKGRAHDDARKQLEEDRNSIIAGAHYDGDVIRREAKAEADSVLLHADAKAKAIEKLAREQAAQEASKLVQAAADEAREIQNAHRLRLEDLKRCVAEMEEKRTAALDIMAKLVGELQEVQDFARRNNVPLPEQMESPDPCSRNTRQTRTASRKGPGTAARCRGGTPDTAARGKAGRAPCDPPGGSVRRPGGRPPKGKSGNSGCNLLLPHCPPRGGNQTGGRNAPGSCPTGTRYARFAG